MTVNQPAPSRRRRLAPLALAALCLLALSALFAAPAFAGTTVLRPTDDALVVKPGRLHVVARVSGPGAGRIYAQIDNRYVTAHFKRRKGKWVAALPIGKLTTGSHTITVTSGSQRGGELDSARFFVARRSRSAVKIGWHTGWRKRSTDLLDLSSRQRIWRTADYPRVYLNGRRVDDQLRYAVDGRGFVGGFGPEAGLRYGRNRVKVQVLLQNGAYATARRTFRVAPDRPIAGAGPDRRTSVGESVLLDGGSTRLSSSLMALVPPPATATPGPSSSSRPTTAASGSSAANPPVEYQWKVISAPKGAAPKLEEAQAEESIFTPEVPGTYVIQNLVEPEGGGPAAIDDVTVEVPQSAEPMGMPIQTITASGGIAIAETESPFKRNGVKLLVLSATTLKPISEPGWGAAEQTFVPQGNGTWVNPETGHNLLEVISKVGKWQTVVLSGQGKPISGGSINKTQSKRLEESIVKVGGTVSTSGQTPQGAADLADGDWSVIGYPGLVEGHARQDIGIGEAALPAGDTVEFPKFPTGAGSPGSLNGFMQQIDTEAYDFVSPEYLELDTKWTKSPGEAPSPTQNTIAVGGRHYESQSIPNGAIAIQVLVLDGSEPTKVLENSTFRVQESNCAAAPGQGGVYSLDQALHHWATESGSSGSPSGSNLVIVQDFGKQDGRCWPGGDDPDWLQDALPKMSRDGTGWNGSSFPTKRSELLSMWNEPNHYGFGSVAGNFGIFAGTVAHDETANYRRPFWSSELGEEITRDYGGLTLVASTNLYQRSSAFFKGQGENAEVARENNPLVDNGTVTGLLRRNEQSQWQLQSSAATAGAYDEASKTMEPFETAGLPELMFKAPTKWPCSTASPAPCKGTAKEIEAAQRYFATQAASSEAKVATIRDLYAQEYEGTHIFRMAQARGPYPEAREQRELGGGEFTKALYETMRFGEKGATWNGLVGELEDVETVGAGIKEWRQFFEINANQATGIQNAGKDVIKEVNAVYDKLEKENKEEEMDASIASSTLYLASELVEIGMIGSGNPEAAPLVAPSIGALASMIDVGSDAADVYSIYDPEKEEGKGEGDVRNDTEAIRAKISDLSAELQSRYTNIAETLQHFGSIFVTDPEKLRLAATHFEAGGAWRMMKDTLTTMRRALVLGVQQAAFETTLPMAYVQWVTSPRWTVQNPGGSAELPYAINYNCSDTNSNGNGTRDPWPKPKKDPFETTWAMESVEYAGAGPIAGTNTNPHVNAQSFDIRGLKSTLDDMHPDRDSEAGEPGLQHSGTMASASLMEKVFSNPGPHATLSFKPEGLSMSKEEIFGLEDWETKKFGCGKEH